MSEQRYKCWLRSAIAAPVLLLPAFAVAGSCSDSDMEALKWLDRMARSADEVSYHGVVTFQRDGEDMQVMQISRVIADGKSSESLTQLTGQGAEVLRINHPLQCDHPGNQLLRLNEALKAGGCGVADQYRFRISEGDRVAGLKAVRLELAPRDMYRYGYVLELDRRTGLLLKSETIGRGNRVLEKFQFADLAYNARQTDGTEVSVVHQTEHPELSSAEPEHSVPHRWKVRWLPRGFTPTDTPDENAARKTYTDGLAVFSVFVEELDRAIRPGEGVARTGSTTSYTRGMDISGEPVLVTVVGEIPVNTARMVADSLAWAER